MKQFFVYKLILVFLLSLVVTLYLIFLINTKDVSFVHFLIVLKQIFTGYSEAISWGYLIGLGLKTFVVVILSIFFGIVCAYMLAKWDLKGVMNVIASFPEVFFLVILWSFYKPVWIPEYKKAFLIVAIESIKSTGVFHKYFHEAFVDYSQSHSFFLNNIREINGKWRYTVKNIIGDSLGNMVFEIPLIFSSVAVLEASFSYVGISQSFFAAIQNSQTDVTMRRSVVILTLLGIIQFVVYYFMFKRDARKVAG